MFSMIFCHHQRTFESLYDVEEPVPYRTDWKQHPLHFDYEI